MIVAGRYRKLRELGRGGMGVVWLAEDQVIGRQVALKELRTTSAGEHERVLREARTAGRLNSPPRRRHPRRDHRARRHVPGDGAGRGADAGRRHGPRGRAAGGPRPGHRAPGADRAGDGARSRDRAPGRQAQQHHGAARRPGEARGLRHRPRHGRPRPDRHRRDHGLARLHGARAVRGQGAVTRERPVGARRDDVPRRGGPVRVRAGHDRGDHARDHVRGTAARADDRAARVGGHAAAHPGRAAAHRGPAARTPAGRHPCGAAGRGRHRDHRGTHDIRHRAPVRHPPEPGRSAGAAQDRDHRGHGGRRGRDRARRVLRARTGWPERDGRGRAEPRGPRHLDEHEHRRVVEHSAKPQEPTKPATSAEKPKRKTLAITRYHDTKWHFSGTPNVAVPPGFSHVDGPLGWLAASQEANTRPLYACKVKDSEDWMTSLDAACEGQTREFQFGWVLAGA